MNRNHVALFLAVAKTGSFSRAAEKLFIGQPAISMQVAELEKQLGVRLLERSRSGVSLTRAGRILFDYANRIEGIESAAQKALDDFKRAAAGALAIGASTTIGSYLLPDLLVEFRRRSPAITVSVELGNTSTIEQKIADGLLDIALVEGLIGDLPGTVVFRHDELIAIGPPSGPLSQATISLATLVSDPLILREPGSGTRAVFDDFLATRGLKAKPAFELTSPHAIKEFVRRGFGRAVISALACREELQSRTLVQCKVSDMAIDRPLHMIKSGGVNPVADTFASQVLGKPRGA
jgi:DNA-binding transcriptional LysR family regulator